MIFNLLNSSALALALCWLITWHPRFWGDLSFGGRALWGSALGAACIVGMLNPIELTSGIIYDARLIIINAAAIFGGPVAGTVAALIAAFYRLWLGGIGAPSGAITIAIALIIGLIFHYAIQKKMAGIKWNHLFFNSPLNTCGDFGSHPIYPGYQSVSRCWILYRRASPASHGNSIGMPTHAKPTEENYCSK